MIIIEQIKQYFKLQYAAIVHSEKLQRSQDEQIEDFKKIINMQNISLSQLASDRRDMYMGPNEFVISGNSDIRVMLKDKDITKSVSKLIVHGPGIITERFK